MLYTLRINLFLLVFYPVTWDGDDKLFTVQHALGSPQWNYGYCKFLNSFMTFTNLIPHVDINQAV